MRPRAPSDTTLVSDSTTLKRTKTLVESPTKKKKIDSGQKSSNNVEFKKKIEKRQNTLVKNGIFKHKQGSKAEAGKNTFKRAKTQVSKSTNSTLSIAGTASRRLRHVSLLRPSAVLSLQRGTGPVVQSASEIQPSGRIVTFGLRQT